jgi:hypothetical protein
VKITSVKISSEELEDMAEVARAYCQGGTGDPELLARDFAETIVQVADACMIGLPCERHGGAVHGREAEELRAGVEQILFNTTDVLPADEESVLASLRKALIFLLDRIDARDSLAFREVTDPTTEHDPPCT